MNGGASEEVEGEFGSRVEDVFLAGFEAWGELGQVQGQLLGGGSGQTSILAGGTISSPPGAHNNIIHSIGGGRAPPGIGSMTGLGGSMQSFLGEAGMYPESTESVGTDSFRDGLNSSGSSSSSSGSSSQQQDQQNHFGGGGGGGVENGERGGGAFPSPCKIEPMEQEQEQQEHDSQHMKKRKQENEDEEDHHGDDDDDDERFNDSEYDEHEEHDYHQYHDDNDDIGAKQQQQQQQQQGGGSGMRGLGRIFGMGTHPVVAEAQARAEALVHGKGGKGSGSSSAAEAAEKKRKRAVLSKEERAKQNRDRNREHARNTRLRKKAFVEELKKQVEELVAGREREERERRAESGRDSSLRDMRLQVLLAFLEYRGRGEMGPQEWQGVVDDNFEMRMPITPYRTFPPHQVQGGMRVVKGIDGLLTDTASLSLATKPDPATAPGRSTRLQKQASSSSLSPALPSSSSSPSSSSDSRKKPRNGGGGGSRSKRSAWSSSSSRGATSSESCSGEESEKVARSSGGTGGDGGRAAPKGASSSSTGPAAVAAAAVAAGVMPSPNRIYYVVDPKEVMANKNSFMTPFLARSPQLLVPGMLRCSFNAKSNRLSSLNFSFDPTVPARQLARAAMLQGRATPGMAGMMAGMLGMGGVDISSAISGGPTDVIASRPSPCLGSCSASPQAGSGGGSAVLMHEDSVLHSVLDDIRDWRVSSTLVDDPKKVPSGKSYLRVYPLNGDTPGVIHFIGVLEDIGQAPAARGGGAASSSTKSNPSSSTDANVGDDAGDGAGAGAEAADAKTNNSVGKATVAADWRRPGCQSDVGTSSACTSDGSFSNVEGVVRPVTESADGGSSGSGGSDDAGSRGGRSTRAISAISACTTLCSDGSSSSPSTYETRRSTRRLHGNGNDNTGNPASPVATGASEMSNGGRSGGGSNSGRGRGREGPRKYRA